ncbi:hypothetical protein BT93_B3139 [Corymbia citriodora subsp. variegata]|nr:hypothetical protein BT93_B3139 [Corymbia citriodora subsp. variegata]KAF8041123.1 hypothetical protein BT93_B3139 [Corymbia citriodora subsp. variegata]KAF8041124.1 hypothetical protein BT93_B3139 [Corymbia citriodora subsp. variegata]KAF8041125.1 hypothetical protein BT93_B3139 [Corymbia citriodora subsp. variegata]
MVFNGVMILRVAHESAHRWQSAVCVPIAERVSSDQLLDLVCCFPLHQLGRLALFIWTFLCVPPPDSNYYSYVSDDDSSDDSSETAVDYDDYRYDSHSD